MAEVNSKSECPYCRKNVGTNGISCLKCMNLSCAQQMHGQCLYGNQAPKGENKVFTCPTCNENNIAFCKYPTDNINEGDKTSMGSAGGRRKYKKHKKTKKHRKHRKYGKTKKR
jgi:hypothetical protein